MKKSWILLCFVLSYAQADPPKIKLSTAPPVDLDVPSGGATAPLEPISAAVPDPNHKDWKEYDNFIVKAHMRINSAWTLMEVKETRKSGTVSFTISRLPLTTFSIMREPMDGSFEAYMSSASLTPLYPTGYKKTRGAFGGRVAFITQGKGGDGRRDESYFLSDDGSLYQISFSAPEENWKDAQTSFDGIKRSFRWLP